MSELPKGWAPCSLEECCIVISGQSPPGETYNEEGIGLPFYQGKSEFNDLYPVPRKWCTAPTKLAEDGDILISVRAPVGPTNLANETCCIGRGLAAARPFRGVETRYVLYQMRATEQQLASVATGSTFSAVSSQQLKDHRVVLAPSNEQPRIVAEIEKQFTRLDAATAALKRVQANLKRYRASVLKAACEGRLVPTEAELARKEGRDYEPADKLLQRILRERRARWEADTLAKMHASGKPPKDDNWKQKYREPSAPDTTNLPTLPEGWCWARAEQLCGFITKGTTPSANKLFDNLGDVPFIKVYNLTFTGRLDFETNPTYVGRQTHERELARSRVVPGDVLMNIVGPPLGKVSVVPDLHDEWNVNQAIAIFRTIEGIEREYLAGLLMTEQILRWATHRAKATAGQFNLTLEICRDLPIPLPPAAEQTRIVVELDRQITNLDRTGLLVDSSTARIANARQSVLSSAFTGRLVPQNPADEPASVLLERVRADRNASATKSTTRRVRKELVHA